jgi:hypothetical protein
MEVHDSVFSGAKVAVHHGYQVFSSCQTLPQFPQSTFPIIVLPQYIQCSEGDPNSWISQNIFLLVNIFLQSMFLKVLTVHGFSASQHLKPNT